MKHIDYAEIFAEQEEIIEKQAGMIRKLTDVIRMYEACENGEAAKGEKENNEAAEGKKEKDEPRKGRQRWKS